MNTSRRGYFARVMFVVLVLVATFKAEAEVPICIVSRVPMAANLPFSADLVEEYWFELPDGSDGVHHKNVFAIARDNIGRVSIKRSGATDLTGRTISYSVEVCDPTAVTLTYFEACVDPNDTSSNACGVKNVATVHDDSPRRYPESGPPVPPHPIKPLKALPPHYSDELLPRSGELTNLGEKVIEGIKAHGYRNVGKTHSYCNEKALTTSKEWWISEETALEVSEVTRSFDPTSLDQSCTRLDTYELTNIQRVEPDPELFRAPSNYEIVRVPLGQTVPRPLE